MEQTIYHVTTEGDVEGRTTHSLGYCTGNIDDIKEYYDDAKTYELRITPITVKHISTFSAQERQVLLETKRKLELELEKIKNKIG